MPKSRAQFAAVSLPPAPRLALSIREFCSAHGISQGLYFKLKKQGEGPREMKVGARTLISFESAAEWRGEREAARAVMKNFTKSVPREGCPSKPARSTPTEKVRAKAKPVKSARPGEVNAA